MGGGYEVIRADSLDDDVWEQAEAVALLEGAEADLHEIETKASRVRAVVMHALASIKVQDGRLVVEQWRDDPPGVDAEGSGELA